MKRWIRWTPLLWIGAGSVVAGMVLWQRCGLLGCPDVDALAAHQPGGESVLLDRNGLPLALLSPLEHRVVSLDALPDYVPAAFIAVEDRRFYRHEGVDWPRVVGAALANLRAGTYAEGSSTLTMQLARTAFPERIRMQDKTLRRKLLEVRVAREIEDRFSKREILELYLNHLYFGAGVYGIEAASRLYFGRGAHELTLEQAGLLAALPRAPAYYDPRRHP
ncbi:MAG: transglycosylase domain-containing protein, partial [Gemmatimonadetes bacterium]|nr:transglycosylase domain-containing protein [Gemmatimonadota bacterium]